MSIFFWGSTYLAIRIGLEGFPPFLMAGMRYTIAGSMLYLFLRLIGQHTPPVVQWRNGAIIGTLLLLVGNGGVVFAEQTVASGLAAILQKKIVEAARENGLSALVAYIHAANHPMIRLFRKMPYRISTEYKDSMVILTCHLSEPS